MFKWLGIEKVNDKVLCMVAIQHCLIYVTETIRSIKDPYCGSLATLFNEKHVRISLSEVCLKSEQAVVGTGPNIFGDFRDSGENDDMQWDFGVPVTIKITYIPSGYLT